MRLKRLLWLQFLLLLVFAGTANADTVQINGTYAFANNGYGIPPYGGTLNGQAQSFYCVDFSSTIAAGDIWSVAVTSLSGTNFSSTLLGNQKSYLEMAWLVMQGMSTTDQLQQAKDQYAIWSFSGGPNPYGTNSSLVAAALAAVNGGFAGQGFQILTPTPGSHGQEFLIFSMPEPTVGLMLVLGLIMLGVTARRKQPAGANAT
jgi:hypothetical protein